jgi:hydroxyacylglutathione hydrolase
VLIDGFPAPAFATNCWVIAPGPGQECIVVDPGISDPNLLPQLQDLLDRHRLHPVAVIATHGHLDHTFSIAPLCESVRIPAYIHSADREFLAHPERAFGPQMATMFSDHQFVEPDDVRELGDGDRIEIAGVPLVIDHAPGHTPGSILIRIESEAVAITGDVLFAGSIGRTDLPGGSMSAMADSLRRCILPLADEYRVFPGHGPTSDIASERATNPYLRAAAEGRLT